jgi:hypothetical protein
MEGMWHAGAGEYSGGFGMQARFYGLYFCGEIASICGSGLCDSGEFVGINSGGWSFCE